MAAPPRVAGLRLGIYVFKDAEIVDFAAPHGVFSVARRFDPELDAFLVADAMRPVQAQAGFTVLPNYAFADAPAMDAFLIPGGFGTRQEMHNRRLHECVRGLPEACLLTGVCTGSWVYGRMGLLDGLPATNRKEPDRLEASGLGQVPLERLAEIAPRARISRTRVVDAGSARWPGSWSITGPSTSTFATSRWPRDDPRPRRPDRRGAAGDIVFSGIEEAAAPFRLKRRGRGMHYAIVGNGVCGMEAALALRARDPGARITLVSDEHEHFFSRPALMYVFAGQTSLRDTEPYDRGLYERMGLERVRGRVRSLDAAGKLLLLENGSRLGYDKLLLAVGSRGRPAPWPGGDGPGLHYFVTLRDLEGLDRDARRGGRAVVIGGGLIGVEVAEILHDRGLHVSFVIRENWYFPLALDRNEAALVTEHMRGHGIDVRLDVNADRIERGDDGRPRAVRLETGEELTADLVVSAIGVVPNTAFLEGSGLSLSKGGAIEVDDALRASAPDVWAAGDCANVTWADGSRRPEQLWYTARDQGRLAARSMLGDEVAYRRGTWYNSAKFFDLEWTTAGWVPVCLNWDNTPIDPGPDVRCWFQRVPGRFVSQRVVTKGERVVGFNFLGSRWNHEPLLDWIHERRSLDWVLEHLHEAQFDEEFMPRFRVLPSAIRTPARA